MALAPEPSYAARELSTDARVLPFRCRGTYRRTDIGWPGSGGRTWWARFAFTRINIEPIILHKKIEDVREAGAVIAAREWTSHDVESTIADVGPFPSIRTQGTIESTREARSAGRKPPEPPACIPRTGHIEARSKFSSSFFRSSATTRRVVSMSLIARSSERRLAHGACTRMASARCPGRDSIKCQSCWWTKLQTST